MLKEDRLPGISFIVKCHNEEDYLRQSVLSLLSLQIPYEIIIILHNCTDRSEEIAVELQKLGFPIKLVKHDWEISRAGFDTLITPIYHPRSLIQYYDFCIGFANYNWLFKWDADFFATPELLNHLMNLDLGLKNPQAHRINCVLGDVSNKEYYLSNAVTHYTKAVFWETAVYKQGVEWIETDDSIRIMSIPVDSIKSYWERTRWYLKPDMYDPILAEKYKALVSIIGEEELGGARASNPNVSDVYNKIRNLEHVLNTQSIYLNQ